MGFLRDPIWQFIGVIVALFALFLTIAQRNRKEIAYEIISDTPLFSVRDEFKDKVQILFNGKSLSDAHLIILRIWNSGNIPISVNEYVEPIRFDFGKKVEVLDADILESTPSNVKASFKIDSGKVVLEPLLLNSQDSIKMKILLTQRSATINVDARIVGVKQILRARRTELTSKLLGKARVVLRSLLIYSVIILALILISSVIGINNILSPLPPLALFLGPFFVLLTAFLALILILLTWLDRVQYALPPFRYKNRLSSSTKEAPGREAVP